ncbi:MAG: hypothetical protein H0W09_02110 [Solirubrobacterales bacterium]|nr:hypothetical protein [Solirubrobacterales bacterium]
MTVTDEQLEAIVHGSAGKFLAPRLADDLTAETPVAAGGAQLYTYEAGYYRPGAEQRLKARIAATLGDEWRRNRQDETLGYLRASAPLLWEAPPRDRLNLENGILDLVDCRLEPHSPDFLSPVRIPVRYEPDATCPEVEEFLGEVLAPELAAVVYEIAGYLLTPDNRLQTAIMFLGEGANGKSVLLNVLTALLGADNVANVPLHKLEEDRFAAAELYGRLVNVYADLDARALQASSTFKAITGGDRILAERKYADAFSFTPYARLLFSANEPPPSPDSSNAFFRRWLILRFEQRFDGRKADRRLLERLTTPAELSGLLNKAIEALPRVRSRGSLLTTPATEKAAERFRVDSDSVAGFQADACEVDLEAKIAKPQLFPAYVEWCTDNNRKPLSKQRFNRRLEALNPALYVSTIGGTEYWRGLALRADS